MVVGTWGVWPHDGLFCGDEEQDGYFSAFLCPLPPFVQSMVPAHGTGLLIFSIVYLVKLLCKHSQRHSPAEVCLMNGLDSSQSSQVDIPKDPSQKECDWATSWPGSEGEERVKPHHLYQGNVPNDTRPALRLDLLKFPPPPRKSTEEAKCIMGFGRQSTY